MDPTDTGRGARDVVRSHNWAFLNSRPLGGRDLIPILRALYRALDDNSNQNRERAKQEIAQLFIRCGIVDESDVAAFFAVEGGYRS